jgi:hypothetical protein
MLGKKVVMLRAMAITLVFAAFCVTPLASLVSRCVTNATSARQAVASPVLSADGTEPLPKPTPWFTATA